MRNQLDSAGSGTNNSWQVEIVTPDGDALHPPATMVELATTDGQIGVMPGHQRLLTTLEVGELVIHNGRQRAVYLVGGGFARVQAEGLSVLAFSLECVTDSAAVQKCRTRQRELLGDDDNAAAFTPPEEQVVRPNSAINSARMA